MPIYHVRTLKIDYFGRHLHGTMKAKSYLMFDLSFRLLNSRKLVTNRSYTSLEINANIYHQLIFDKDAKERKVFLTNGSGTTGPFLYHIQELSQTTLI